MWLKKKSALLAEHHYDTEKSADGTTDMRTTMKTYYNNSSSIKYSGLPSAADAGNYFYLPALGYYVYGQLCEVGDRCFYWSSSAYPTYSNSEAYQLIINPGDVRVSFYSRYHGFRVGEFK